MPLELFVGWPIDVTNADVTNAKIFKDGSYQRLIDVLDDPQTDALAGLSPTADTVPYFTGATTAAVTGLTAFARTLIDDANAAAARSTLGLAIGADVQAQDAELTAIAGLASAADRLPYFTGNGTASLATFTAFGRSLVDDADAATARGTLGAAASGANSDITSLDIVNALSPPALFPDGVTAGENADRLTVTRASGFGTYGARLTTFSITDATPAGEFDVGSTTWVTHRNLTGGAVFGSWRGSNTPSAALGQTFSGGSAIGQEINVGNRWADFGLMTDVGGTRYTVGQQIIPDVLPAVDGINSTNVTISVASPAVVTFTAHGMVAGTGVVFGGAGTIPTGLVKGTTYYVSATGLAANTFQVSATPGGASINTTGSFVATIWALPSWPGSFGQVIGASVHAHRWWVGYLTRYDTIMPGGYHQIITGGSVASQAPLAATYYLGYWTNGLDFSAGSYSNAVMKFGAGQLSGSATAGGGQAVPATVNGYIIIDVSGSLKRIPYFNA